MAIQRRRQIIGQSRECGGLITAISDVEWELRRLFPPYRAYDGKKSAMRLSVSLVGAAALHSLLLLLSDPRSSFSHLSAGSAEQAEKRLLVRLAPAPKPVTVPVQQAPVSRPSEPESASLPPQMPENKTVAKTTSVPEPAVHNATTSVETAEKSAATPPLAKAQVVSRPPGKTIRAQIVARSPRKKAHVVERPPEKKVRAQITERSSRKKAQVQVAKRPSEKAAPEAQNAQGVSSEKMTGKVTERVRSETAARAMRALGAEVSGTVSASAVDHAPAAEPVLSKLATVIAPRTKVARPLYRKNQPPEYPRKAKRRGYQGVVALAVLVDVDGRVNDLKVARSSGYNILDRAAMRSVRKWDFQPGSENGRKIEMWVEVPIRFNLRSK